MENQPVTVEKCGEYVESISRYLTGLGMLLPAVESGRLL